MIQGSERETLGIRESEWREVFRDFNTGLSAMGIISNNRAETLKAIPDVRWWIMFYKGVTSFKTGKQSNSKSSHSNSSN